MGTKFEDGMTICSLVMVHYMVGRQMGSDGLTLWL